MRGAASGTAQSFIQSAGGGNVSAHNNMPPYFGANLFVYVGV